MSQVSKTKKSKTLSKKSFSDFQFRPHRAGNGLHWICDLGNGIVLSIVRFKSTSLGGIERFIADFCATNDKYASHTANEKQWELGTQPSGGIVGEYRLSMAG